MVSLRQGLRLTPKTIGNNLLAGMFSSCGYRFFLSLLPEQSKNIRAPTSCIVTCATGTRPVTTKDGQCAHTWSTFAGTECFVTTRAK
jgi:hypothetical protein